jgi:3-oxoacyl-[acyl-carrier protein] reductase
MKGLVFELTNTVAIVTGGGTGIGRAISMKLAEAGADVVVTSRNPDHLEPVTKDIASIGRRSLAVTADVRKPDDVAHVMKRVTEEFEGVDILVNNAGASFRCAAEDISPNGWNAIIGINLTGPFLFSQAAAKIMMKGGGGKIINISSIGGRDGDPGMAAYGAAKAGLINLTKTLAVEWASHNIYVNCIAPGLIFTEGVMEVFGMDKGAPPPRVRTALGRGGWPDEIANTVLFLASEASSYITGQTLCVDGGQGPRVKEGYFPFFP